MQVINKMLSNYKLNSNEDRKHAIKEIVQEIILSGLARSNFFNGAAFYGDTALRIFYNLDRFSEDLDFTLLVPNHKFNLNNYIPIISNEVESLGLRLAIEEKQKAIDTNIKSVFVRGNTKEQFLMFYPNIEGEASLLHPDEMIKIKFEIDVNPPKFATTEVKYKLLPYPYQVKVYDLPSLFAGKIDAVLSRTWKHRVKGRDFYDYIFFLSMDVPVNIKHLKARLIQSNYIKADYDLNEESLKDLLNRRFNEVDFEAAKKDVLPFINNIDSLSLWSKDLFKEITKKIKIK